MLVPIGVNFRELHLELLVELNFILFFILLDKGNPPGSQDWCGRFLNIWYQVLNWLLVREVVEVDKHPFFGLILPEHVRVLRVILCEYKYSIILLEHKILVRVRDHIPDQLFVLLIVFDVIQRL